MRIRTARSPPSTSATRTARPRPGTSSSRARSTSDSAATWVATNCSTSSTRQDTDALLGLLHRMTVAAGDAVYVPPGVLHATGEGVFLVEVQEPEDLSILLEWRDFELDGAADGHLGLGFPVVIDAVDRVGRSADEVEGWIARCREGEGLEGEVLPHRRRAVLRPRAPRHPRKLRARSRIRGRRRDLGRARARDGSRRCARAATRAAPSWCRRPSVRSGPSARGGSCSADRRIRSFSRDPLSRAARALSWPSPCVASADGKPHGTASDRSATSRRCTGRRRRSQREPPECRVR